MIYVLLAEGFEETEAIAVIDVLRRGGCNVTTVAVGTTTNLVTGAHGVPVQADIVERSMTVEDLTAVVLPGGMPGTLNLGNSPLVRACLEHCAAHHKWICAICAAPSVLGHLGLLEGKTATCYPGFEQELIGAKVVPQGVVRDGNVITAKGPGYAVDFGLAIVETMQSKEVADTVSEGMLWPHR